MEYIHRALERRLLQALHTYKAVLVTGSRQVGKSTLLKRLLPDFKYVSLDDPFLERQARDDGDMFLTLNGPPLVIDEIQYAPELFRYLKIACDGSERRGLFCLSGSQRFELMKDVSETMSGRISIIELNGLSLREILGDPFAGRFIPTLEYVQGRRETARPPENIWEVIHRGSYPALQDPGMDWSSYYANYLKTYVERDVRGLSAVQDLDSFQRFMIAGAARTGEVLNLSRIADEIGRDVTTVRNWISILEASGIVFLLEPFADGALKRAVRTPKLYFRDTGLVCYLTRWLTAENLAYGAMSGHVFETFVVSEILKSYANEGLDYRRSLSYYRRHGRARKAGAEEQAEGAGEIDLIIEENGVVHPVEIKQGSRIPPAATAAFRTLDRLETRKRGMGAVVCNCPQPGMLRENILQLPAWYV